MARSHAVRLPPIRPRCNVCDSLVTPCRNSTLANWQLAQARAEIGGWSARQGLLQAQLAAERDAGRAKAAQLVEAQEALASVKSVVLASKEDELADVQRALRVKEAEVAEVMRRVEHMGDQLALCREELKLRSEQQRLTSEQLKGAQEALRSRESELHLQSELTKTQQARADVMSDRIGKSAHGSETLHAQLATAHDRVAVLSEQLATARAKEKRAIDDAAAARDEMSALEAKAEGALARCKALGDKVRISRDARLQTQEVIDKREAELRRARAEITALQGQLGYSLERQVAMHGAAA